MAEEREIWLNIHEVIQQLHDDLGQLQFWLSKVIGKGGGVPKGRFDAWMKGKRRLNGTDDYTKICTRLQQGQNCLNIALLALQARYNQKLHTSQEVGFGNLAQTSQKHFKELQDMVKWLQEAVRGQGPDGLQHSLASIHARCPPATSNKRFYTPQSVMSYYTGRRAQLRQLEQTLAESRGRQTHQMRFVIHGLGGSGKTQFCCKFAQDNREHYWGVFWVDARSTESAKHSFAEIARIAGTQPDTGSEKNWLSNLREPWFLLIDNADNPDVKVTDLIPAGELGVVLITTRDPAMVVNSTRNAYSLCFDQVEAEDARDLLLVSAARPQPWSPLAKKHAVRIVQMLGYLPLAIVHAGKAISKKLCSFEDYPEYYQRTWRRIRRPRSESRRPKSSLHTDSADVEYASNMSVFSSYEMIYLDLERKNDQRSKDALELLKTFSFVYGDNITMELLIAAATNPRRERTAATAEPQIPSNRRGSMAWKQAAQEWLVGSLACSSSQVVIPAVQRDEDLCPFEKDRLCRALFLLYTLGLLGYREETNSYWLHPLQALWCEAAATVLLRSIFTIAPSDLTIQDLKLKRQVYPDLQNIQRYREKIADRLNENRAAHKLLFRPSRLFPHPDLQKRQILEEVKHSLVYQACSEWQAAEALQRRARDYIFGMLGPESRPPVQITLLLAINFRLQTRNNEARLLLQQALQASERQNGLDHPTTLRIKDALGSTCLACNVISRFERLDGYGPGHEHTLTARHHLALVKERFLEYDEAFNLLQEAYEGFKEKCSGQEKTLEVQSNLAWVYGFVGEQHLPKALVLSEKVTRLRTKTLGENNLATLASMLTSTKLKIARGRFDEAERSLHTGLLTAQKSLGGRHLGTLWRKGQYVEAQEVLEKTIEAANYEHSKRADGEHIDRVQAMWFLVHCYEDQDKISDAVKMSEQVAQLVGDFGGEGIGRQHKLWSYIQEKQELRQLEAHSGKIVLAEGREGIPPPKKIVKGLTF
ncbi:tetratricopeptide repeat domain-containing protein [Aspergillus lucknowensis]|uniref:Tetratricopeptide repeat domain-containing protein n=1 Tax=Aspergillus lucknowensis TaxID=176173 RepID=A0ABR4M1N9_9EURO